MKRNISYGYQLYHYQDSTNEKEVEGTGGWWKTKRWAIDRANNDACSMPTEWADVLERGERLEDGKWLNYTEVIRTWSTRH